MDHPGVGLHCPIVGGGEPPGRVGKHQFGVDLGDVRQYRRGGSVVVSQGSGYVVDQQGGLVRVGSHGSWRATKRGKGGGAEGLMGEGGGSGDSGDCEENDVSSVA